MNFRLPLSLAFLAIPLVLAAASPTDSPTATATSTATATATATPAPTPVPTAGEGVFGFSASTLVSGSGANSMQISYQAGSTAFSPAGLLTLYFPLGLEAPSPANFFAQPSQQGLVQGYSYSGRTVSVKVGGLAPSASLLFLYGYNATGFFVSSTQSSEAFWAYSYPQSVSLGAGGLLPLTPAFISIVTATFTPTATATSTPTPSITFTETALGTYTETPTSTITDTFTESPTFTISPTFTPIGPEEAGTVYSYPNPYDMQKFDKVTFRFPADPGARVTVFNLAGEPVRELSTDEINGAQGWAIWSGIDGYQRRVPGGLYYVRIRGKNTLIRKFTVFN